MLNLLLLLFPVLNDDLEIFDQLYDHSHLLLCIISPCLPSVKVSRLLHTLNRVLKGCLSFSVVALVVKIVNCHEYHSQLRCLVKLLLLIILLFGLDLWFLILNLVKLFLLCLGIIRKRHNFSIDSLLILISLGFLPLILHLDSLLLLSKFVIGVEESLIPVLDVHDLIVFIRMCFHHFLKISFILSHCSDFVANNLRLPFKHFLMSFSNFNLLVDILYLLFLGF